MDEERVRDVIEDLHAGLKREDIANKLRAFGYTDEQVEELIAEAERRGTETSAGGSRGDESTAAEAGLIAFSDLLKEGFVHAVSRPWLIVSILVTFVGITTAAVLSMLALVGLGTVTGIGSAAAVTLLVILGLVVFTVLIVLYIAAGTAIMKVAIDREEEAQYFPSIGWTLRHIWPIVVIGLLLQLSTATGYALFVLPGIALAIYTAFSYFVFIREEKRGMTALIRSIDLVYGKWWGVFLRMIGFGFVTLLAIAVPAFLLGLLAEAAPVMAPALVMLYFIVAYPFLIVWLVFGMALLFESLVVRRPKEQFDPAAYSTLRTILIIAVVLGIPLLIGWNVYSVYDGMRSGAFPEDHAGGMPMEFEIQ